MLWAIPKEFWNLWWWFMIESGSGYLEMRTRFDSQHQRGYTLGLEFTLIRWDDNHSSIHPSRKAKRIVQVSSLCLVENKLEGKTFIHSFTPPSIHPSIHPFGRPKHIPSAKGTSARSFGPPCLQSTLCSCYKLYTIATIMKEATNILANWGTVVLSLTY